MSDSLPDMLDFGKRILVAQPFSVLLGAELLALTEGPPNASTATLWARRVQVPDSSRSEAARWIRARRGHRFCRRQCAQLRGRQRPGRPRGDCRLHDQLSETRHRRFPGRARGGRALRKNPGRLSMRRFRLRRRHPSSLRDRTGYYRHAPAEPERIAGRAEPSSL